jgi:hypothetical protein
LQGRMGRLTSDENHRAQTFLHSADTFWRASSALHDRLPTSSCQMVTTGRRHPGRSHRLFRRSYETRH